MPDQKLPLKTKILYSFGQFGVTIPTYFIGLYLFTFYAPTSGKIIVPAMTVAVAYFLGTLVQALANPIIGGVSDRSHFRAGRRKFFMITGFAPLVLFFLLIWFPLSGDGLGEALLFAYMIGFNFLYAYVIAPYLSLIPEISVTSRDRIRLTAISGYFSIFGIILSSLVPIIMLGLNYPLPYAAAVLSILVFVSFLLAYVSTTENPQHHKVPEYSLTQAIAQTFRNKTFNRYIFAYSAFQFGFYFFVTSLGYYVENLIYPHHGYKMVLALLSLVAVLSAVVLSVFLVRYSDRHGEKKTFVVFTSYLGVVLMLTAFVGITGFLSNLWQAVILMIVAGPGLASYFILPNAVVSEIIDEDEVITGYRREAMYFGIQGLLERIPSSLAVLAVGAWMTFVFIPTGNMIFIRLLGVIGGSFVILTSVLFRFVPLKEDILRHGDNREP